MKKFLQCVGTLLVSAILSYLVWLGFYYLVPYVMGVSWIWYLIFGSLFIGVFASLGATLIMLPIIKLTKDNTPAKVINAIIMGINGVCTVALPWRVFDSYNFSRGFIAVLVSISIVIIFYSLISMPFNKELK